MQGSMLIYIVQCKAIHLGMVSCHCLLLGIPTTIQSYTYGLIIPLFTKGYYSPKLI